MKRFILYLFLLFLPAAAFADTDKSIKTEELPEKALTFIKAHFPDVKISYAKMEIDLFEKSYEVFLVDGSKVEFDRKGKWKEIKCSFSQVPKEAIPEQIRKYVSAYHNTNKIVAVDRDRKDYEVELDNGMELKFNLKFEFIGYDH